jgi:hypothetical protein
MANWTRQLEGHRLGGRIRQTKYNAHTLVTSLPIEKAMDTVGSGCDPALREGQKDAFFQGINTVVLSQLGTERTKQMNRDRRT